MKHLKGSYPSWQTFEDIALRCNINREYGFLNVEFIFEFEFYFYFDLQIFNF